jgi:hypothetical protein
VAEGEIGKQGVDKFEINPQARDEKFDAATEVVK